MHTVRRFTSGNVGRLFLTATFATFAAGAVLAAGDKPGRYSMSPAEGGGFVRLDTETGQMSVCQRREGDWTCRDMSDPGRGLASEIDRLREDNQRLRALVRQMEDLALAEKGTGPRKPEFKLPTEEEVDAAMSYAERMLRKFRDKLKEFEGSGRGTPL